MPHFFICLIESEIVISYTSNKTFCNYSKCFSFIYLRRIAIEKYFSIMGFKGESDLSCVGGFKENTNDKFHF